MLILKVAYGNKMLECVKNSSGCSFNYFCRNTINTKKFSCTLSLSSILNIKIKKACKNTLAKRIFAIEVNEYYGNPNWDVPISILLGLNSVKT